jgi:hypothetical protein
MVAFDQVTGRRRPSSGAFQPDDDGISVYRDAILRSNGLSPDDIRKFPWNLVVGVGVADLRTIALDVRDDPWPTDIDEPDHPRNAAHALIVGFTGLSRNERRKRQQALVQLASVDFVT